MMRLRQAIRETQRDVDGPVAKTVALLAMRGFTAWDAFSVPTHILYAVIMLVTPTVQMRQSPVYNKVVAVAPVVTWAGLLIALSLMVLSSILIQTWWMARLAYVLMCAWWLFIAFLVYLASATLLSPIAYLLIAAVCLYRQAEIAVGYGDGRR
jgi:hypothetical protein